MKQIKHYQFSKVFNEICEPIFATSPITFCSIGRLFQDGTYTSFMSDPTWTEHYLKKHYFPTLKLWLEAEISQHQPGFSLWTLSSIFSKNEALAALQKDCFLFDYKNGINIVDVYPNYFELTRFSSGKAEGVDDYFIEKQDELRHFILYLKEKIQSNNCLAAEFNAHYVLPYQLDTLLLQGVNNKENCTQNKVSKFYIGYPLKEEHYLTKNEISYLIPYLLGIPKVKIATQYHISVRTVEKHIENIKEKCVYGQLSFLRPLFLNNKFISAMTDQVLRVFIEKPT